MKKTRDKSPVDLDAYLSQITCQMNCYLFLLDHSVMSRRKSRALVQSAENSCKISTKLQPTVFKAWATLENVGLDGRFFASTTE